MKKSFSIFSVMPLFCLNVFAMDCPKYKLNCVHQVIDSKNGVYKTIEAKSASFDEFNSDEPSEPANECAAAISFRSLVANETLNVYVQEDLRTYLYVGINYGARNPQFEVEAVLDKEMILSRENEKMICTLMH